MRLSSADLARVLRILEKVDAGLIGPRVPGGIGRFLRQYERSRADLSRILNENRIDRRADAAISGRALGTIEIHSVLDPEVSLIGLPLGEVASALTISEQLGVLTHFDMWLKGPVANAAYNLLKQNRSLCLTGDYRWSPPVRLTPGEARLDPSDTFIGWQRSRCIKAVADDLNRPPHALEYVVDYRMGPPGLKCFRAVCAVGRRDGWAVLPALTEPKALELSTSTIPLHPTVGGILALLIYCEPWSREWTVVAGVRISEEDAFAHAVTWADFRRELDGSVLDAATISGIRESFRATGLKPQGLGEPNLARSLLPVPREILRWLRGSG